MTEISGQEPTVHKTVVFLTESGHRPTDEIAKAYLDLFSSKIRDSLRDLKKASVSISAKAGPFWNIPENLISAIQTNPIKLHLAIFIDGSTCQLIGKEYFDAIKKAAKTATEKTSWQIVMQALSDTDIEV